GEGGIVGRLLSGGRVQQHSGPLQGQLSIAMLRGVLVDACLGAVDLRLEGGLFEHIEQVALLDFGTLDKVALVEKGSDASDERYTPDRLDTADKLLGLRDLLPLDADYADRWRTARRRLGHRLRGQQREP